MLVGAEFGVLEAAVERGVEEGAGRLDRHALADAVFAARPAGVDQPAIDVASGDPLLEEVAVDRRMALPEARADAGRDGRFRLGHASLGARYFPRVAGQAMIHR